MAARLVLLIVYYYSESYYIKRAKLLRVNNFADVDLEFQEAVLPVVEIAYFVCRVAQLVLLLLTFKWPGLAGIIYASDLLCLALWTFVPCYDISQLIDLTYNFLLV